MTSAPPPPDDYLTLDALTGDQRGRWETVRSLAGLLWAIPAAIVESNKITRARIREAIKNMEEVMTSSIDRLSASYEGISGDVQALKTAVQTLTDRGDALQTALDGALADQTQKVQAAVSTAVAEARASFNQQLDEVAARFEALDAQTPVAGGGTTEPAPAAGEQPATPAEGGATITPGEEPLGPPADTGAPAGDVTNPASAEDTAVPAPAEGNPPA